MVRRRRGRIVLTTGVFDIIHPGHVRMLQEAKKLAGRGGKLVVVVARNETVVKNKGREPVFDEKIRRFLVESLKPVDEAILGYRPFSFEKILRRVKPDVVVFGYDQAGIRSRFEEFCRARGIKVRVVTLRRYSLGKINSSSDVFKRVEEVLRG